METSKYNLFDMVKKDSKIAVISHVHPDGDSLGSVLGLGLTLRLICDEVYMFRNDEIPKKFKFLPCLSFLELYDEKSSSNIFDICFILDCGDKERLGYSEKIMEQSKKTINIDHHISNTMFADINIIDLEVSSTCELLYKIIKEAGLKPDTSAASCLYTGIATDTGNFVYDNTTAHTHEIAAELMRLNINLREINHHLYQNKDIKGIRLLGHVIHNMEFLYNNKVVITSVPGGVKEKFGISFSEIDGIVSFVRDIEGVEVSVMLTEISADEVKVGFRSKTSTDVSKLAREFGGGGHRKASGAVVKGTMDGIKREIEEKIRYYLGG